MVHRVSAVDSGQEHLPVGAEIRLQPNYSALWHPSFRSSALLLLVSSFLLACISAPPVSLRTSQATINASDPALAVEAGRLVDELTPRVQELLGTRGAP